MLSVIKIISDNRRMNDYEEMVMVEWYWRGNLKYLDKILSLCQFIRHESRHGLAWDRTRTSAVGGRWLSADPSVIYNKR
jgi:hypothetical protein